MLLSMQFAQHCVPPPQFTKNEINHWLTRSQSCGLLSWRSSSSRRGSRLTTSQSTNRLMTSPRVVPTKPPSPWASRESRGLGEGVTSPPQSRSVHLPFVSVPLPVPFFIKKGLRLGRRLGSSSSSASSSSGDSAIRKQNLIKTQQHRPCSNNAKKRTRRKHEDDDSIPPIRIVSTTNSCPKCSQPIGSHPDTGTLSASVDAISRTRMHSVVVRYDSVFDESYTKRIQKDSVETKRQIRRIPDVPQIFDERPTYSREVRPATVSTPFSPPISPFLLKAPHCAYCNRQFQILHHDGEAKDCSELRLVLPVDQASAKSEGPPQSQRKD